MALDTRPSAHMNAMFSFTTGSITFCRGVVIPDTVGHEYSHSVVQHSFHDGTGRAVGPTYYGESGALNEGFADVMGEMFEKSFAGTTDWKEMTSTILPPTPVRDLANPPMIPFYEGGPAAPDRHYSSYLWLRWNRLRGSCILTQRS